MNQKIQLNNNLTNIKRQINFIDGISNNIIKRSEFINNKLNANKIRNMHIAKSAYIDNDNVVKNKKDTYFKLLEDFNNDKYSFQK